MRGRAQGAARRGRGRLMEGGPVAARGGARSLLADPAEPEAAGRDHRRAAAVCLPLLDTHGPVSFRRLPAARETA